ncbi:hypothetical protein [Planomicrobium sp. MB-3u-38]|uniref:hypothetical protein n=1 Tax=Planomicrobium sp. MB-3u-38 TaxID=2058318 RepID=UPI000C7AA805|nr:hypothetical protein [Planomicrobium sp. MB-3u-38]PKH09868.1 hypothetical protein CXF70_11695 [Planomicrobium sp. MB-3u-38]
MKTLKVADKVYEAEKIIKTETDIIGYTNGHEIFKFSGVRNMDVFILANGAEWDQQALSEREELEIYKRRLDEMENALLSLIDMSLMGGI